MLLKSNFTQEEKQLFNDLAKGMATTQGQLRTLKATAKRLVEQIVQDFSERNTVKFGKGNNFQILDFNFRFVIEYEDTKDYQQGFIVVQHIRFDEIEKKEKLSVITELGFTSEGLFIPNHLQNTLWFLYGTILEYIHNYSNKTPEPPKENRLPLALERMSQS